LDCTSLLSYLSSPRGPLQCSHAAGNDEDPPYKYPHLRKPLIRIPSDLKSNDIQEAITRWAFTGDTIEISGQTYELNLNLDDTTLAKSKLLRDAFVPQSGSPFELTIEGNDITGKAKIKAKEKTKPVINFALSLSKLDTPRRFVLIIRDLILQGGREGMRIAPNDGAEKPRLIESEVKIERSEITSNNDHGISIVGSKSIPPLFTITTTISRSNIKDNKTAGVRLQGGARAVVTGGSITGNGGAGLYLEDGAQVDTSGNLEITKNAGGGIFLAAKRPEPRVAKACPEKAFRFKLKNQPNELREIILKSALVCLKETSITRNAGAGISITIATNDPTKSRDCKIPFSSTTSSDDLPQDIICDIVITDPTIEENKGDGIQITGAADVIIASLTRPATISGSPAPSIDPGCAPASQRAQEYGVRVAGAEAEVTILDGPMTVRCNTKEGIILEEGARLTVALSEEGKVNDLQRLFLTDNGENGLHVGNEANVRMEGALILRNGAISMQIQDRNGILVMPLKAMLELYNNGIYEHAGYGIAAYYTECFSVPGLTRTSTVRGRRNDIPDRDKPRGNGIALPDKKGVCPPLWRTLTDP
jgi:hypothetical protein